MQDEFLEISWWGKYLRILDMGMPTEDMIELAKNPVVPTETRIACPPEVETSDKQIYSWPIGAKAMETIDPKARNRNWS